MRSDSLTAHNEGNVCRGTLPSHGLKIEFPHIGLKSLSLRMVAHEVKIAMELGCMGDLDRVTCGQT